MVHIQRAQNIMDNGQFAHGGVFFTGVGDCTSVTVGTTTYTRDDTPDVTLGEWASGAGAAAAATNLAAAINGDTRTALAYSAEAIGAGVVIRGVSAGSTGNVAVARVAGTEPSSTQNLVQGFNSSPVLFATVDHVVTAFDVLLTEFTLKLPLTPNTFIFQVTDTTGAEKTVTDTFTTDTSPAGVLVTFAGATHLIAGDIITVMAMSV